MGTANLAATISLSTIFGAVLLWILVYYAHRYIRRVRLISASWFHLFATQEDFGRERADTPHVPEEVRQRGGHGEEQRERDKRTVEFESDEGPREARRKEKARKNGEEWENGKSKYETASYISQSASPSGRRRDRRDEPEELNTLAEKVLLQPYPYVPAYLPAFVPLAQPYVPQFMPVAFESAMFPGHIFSMGDEERPAYKQLSHGPMLEDAYAEEPAPYEQYEPEDPVEGSVSHHSVVSSKVANEPLRTDFIEICDEYPDFVKNDLERKQRLKDRDTAHTDSDSSSSSEASSTTVEEVPRAYIPMATQRTPFVYPQDPRNPFVRDPRLTPRSYPRQW